MAGIYIDDNYPTGEFDLSTIGGQAFLLLHEIRHPAKNEWHGFRGGASGAQFDQDIFAGCFGFKPPLRFLQ